ncbi:MAG: hypothetical protein JSS02_21275 [Planctomycetes bacterium]|nr:hypothetical protein [Planctomycetota bacterium]
MEENTLTERPFMQLLSDAVALMLLAEEHERATDAAGLFSRSSLLHIVFSLESAANCALMDLMLSKRMAYLYENFSLIDKFEAILTLEQPHTEFDRGCRSVQAVQELIAIRNRYVHPKASPGPLIGEAILDRRFAVESGIHQTTKISHRPVNWSARDARHAIECVIGFLDQFFIDWCKFSDRRVEALLVSSVRFDAQLVGNDPGPIFGIICDKRVAELLQQARLAPRFVDFDRWRREAATAED